MVSRNTTPFQYFLLLILAVETTIAFLGNGFIIVVNTHRWLQSRKMLPSDLLMTALGTSRFLLQFVSMIVELLHFFTSELFCDTYLWTSLFNVWMYFSSVSVWCATLLSVFYCVKIINFPHTVFLWLKPRIDKLVPRLLGLSLIIFSLLFIAIHGKIRDYCNPTGNMTQNVTQGVEIKNFRTWNFISLQFTFTAINISICLTAFILLFISLWRHTRNLKRSGFVTKDLNTQAHISVVYSLSSFLFFYILYIFALIISLIDSPSLSSIEELVSNVVQALCPSAHSIILILTNPKLKEVFKQVLKIRQRTS